MPPSTSANRECECEEEEKKNEFKDVQQDHYDRVGVNERHNKLRVEDPRTAWNILKLQLQSTLRSS